ncbi:hypothetical protein BZ163_17215 [Pseudomonas sp. VI4.1]|nr:hypothetical protein BZ163_17215 [Pseudomonas sp. VI4.1]
MRPDTRGRYILNAAVGASLLAMVVNDNACLLTERVALEPIASKLAPTVDSFRLTERHVFPTKRTRDDPDPRSIAQLVAPAARRCAPGRPRRCLVPCAAGMPRGAPGGLSELASQIADLQSRRRRPAFSTGPG